MKKINYIFTIFLIVLIIFSIVPLQLIDLGESKFINDDYKNNLSSIKDSSISTTYPLSIDNTEVWNKVDNSQLTNQFQISDSINEKQNHFEINNCNDWSLKNDFYFTEIREEKILNGDAESTDILWTDFIPLDFEENVTRTNNPPSGEILSDDYSWYFDVKTNDHSTIAGFDNPINLSSNSVIFSLSYSLLRNNLGTSYDSNICIRLFFQFDVYIFLWFSGNTAVLSNVTGPGGYADLIVNQASFNGNKNEYSLNITALGLELFDQEPDQLRSLAIQTWGEIPYQMEFMLDDISLTTEINPAEIELNVNNNLVSGEGGNGYITFTDGFDSIINYNIEYNSPKKILWNCNYLLTGTSKLITDRTCSFENWSQIRWTETYNDSYMIPSNASNLIIYKWLPIDWTLDFIKIDNLITNFVIDYTNLTHQRISSSSLIYSTIEIQYLSDNYIEDLSLSNYEITHNDKLSITVESRIYNKEIQLYIINSTNQIIYASTNYTNSNGAALFSNIELNSELEKGYYSVIAFWYISEHIGIGEKTLEITTFPTKIVAINDYVTVKFNQIFKIEVIFLNYETGQIINSGLVEYNWNYGFGQLQQDPISKSYFVNIAGEGINPGFYMIDVCGSKEGYANAFCFIEIEIIFSDINLSLIGPTEAIPGEIISITAFVVDNFSNPLPSMELRFKINAQIYIDSWTNNSGYTTILYPLSPVYQYNTLNISCAILIDGVELLFQTILISINLFEMPRIVSLGLPQQINNLDTNETTCFKFQIEYPSIGFHWYVSIPSNFEPLSSRIQTETKNITANISPGYISWTRDIENMSINNDILIIEIFKPVPSYEVNLNKNSIILDLHFQTNLIPFIGVEIQFKLMTEWLKFDTWNLYLNGIDVSEECELEFIDNTLYFKIYSSDQITLLNYQLKGTKTALIQISSSTIVLGIGTLLLTIVSIILLKRRKSNLSLDIQM